MTIHKQNSLRQIRQAKLLSVFLHVLVALPYFFLIKPIFTLTEDFYVAYLLGNGFGTGSTHLLHYNNGMHPLISGPVSFLFSVNNSYNWYSLCLVAIHFTSCSLVFYCLLKKTKHWLYLLTYWVLFFVFEADNLLHVNFNNTAIILSIAAVVWVFNHLSEPYFSSKQLLIAGLLLITASLFRLHVLLVITGVCLPFVAMQLTRKNVFSVVVAFLGTAIVIFGLHKWHEQYYEKQIGGWKQEEYRRQQVYQLYNTRFVQQVDSANASEYAMYCMARKGLLADTMFLQTSQLDAMLHRLESKNNLNFLSKWKQWLATAKGNNWFWVNNRLFILTTFLLVMFLPQQQKTAIATFIALALLLGGATYLLLYARLMDYVVINSLYIIGLLAVTGSADKPVVRGVKKIVLIIGLMALLSWGLAHSWRSNRRNEAGIRQFKTCYNAIAKATDTLFIITSYDFPLQQFCIWDAPRNYPLNNFISNEHFLLNIQHPVLKRFGMSDFNEVIYRNDVLFWGKEALFLKQYFKQSTGRELTVSLPLSGFPAGAEIRKITVAAQPE
jgi:hypothetical protein